MKKINKTEIEMYLKLVKNSFIKNMFLRKSISKIDYFDY